MLVVLLHLNELWHVRLMPGDGSGFWHGGAAGVDIFFVISGFVTLVSSHHLSGVPGGWRIFARRRIERILPLYWIATTLKILFVVALPALAHRTVLEPGIVVASYLFLPWHDPHGMLGPVLPVGWTLNMEAGFYLLFAIALAIGFGVLPVVLPILATIAALSPLVTPDWPGVALYFDPIVLEFGAGLCIAALAMRGRFLPAPLAAVALLAGLGIILLVPPTLPRLLCWGIPAMSVVAGTVALEVPLRRLLPRWLLLLGDASYSIYLMHGFVVAAIGVGLVRAGLSPQASLAAALLGGAPLCAVVGVACHFTVERPLAGILRRILPTARPDPRRVMTPSN